MPTPFLAINYRDGNNRQVKRYINASPSNQGVPFSSTNFPGAGEPAISQMRPGLVVQCEGSRTFYALSADQTYGAAVWKSTDAGTTWPIGGGWPYSIPNFDFHYSDNPGGLRLMNDSSGKTILVAYYWVGWNTQQLYFSAYNGVSWGSQAGIGQAFGDIVDTIVFNGNMYVFLQNQGTQSQSVVIYDPATNLVSSINFPAPSQVGCTGSLCQFNGELLALIHTNTTTAQIYALQGSSWILRATLANAGTLLSSDAKEQLFSDGTSLYALYKENGAAWRFIQLDTSFNQTVLTSFLPVPMLSGVPNTARVGIIVDGEANPGAPPALFAYYAINGQAATPWSCYQISTSSTWQFFGSGGSAADSMPFQKELTGEFFWTGTDKDVRFVSVVPAVGGIRIGFILSSDSGSDAVGLRAFFGTDTDPYATRPATLSNPDVGALSGAGSGNSVVSGSGLIADNSTVYHITWLAGSETPSFSSGQRAKFILEQI